MSNEQAEHDPQRDIRRALYLAQRRLEAEDRLLYRFMPNERQIEFMNLTAPYMEKGLCGMNQGGKTYDGDAETAMHALGDYDDFPYYTGHRFEGNIPIWCGNESIEQTQAVIVKDLLGEEKEPGAKPKDPAQLIHTRYPGFIPKNRIKHIEYAKSPAVPGQVDQIWVARKDGSTAKIDFFSFAKLPKRLQSRPVKIIRIDEEPPFNVFDELSARTNRTGGVVILTYCPLQGYTQLYNYLQVSTEQRRQLRYGIDHCSHFTEEERQILYRKYEGHPMRGPRLMGLPAGEGLCFPDYRRCLVDPGRVRIDDNWPRIIGYDLPHSYGIGSTGTFAAVWFALSPYGDKLEDRDLYVYAAYKSSGQTRADYINACIGPGRMGNKIPGAFPHDANRRNEVEGDTNESKLQLDLFKEGGLHVLPKTAHMLVRGKEVRRTMTFIELANEKMAQGRLFVLNHEKGAPTGALVNEWDTYRYEGGEPAKKQDDHCSDAFLKGFAMRRYAKPLDGSFTLSRPTIVTGRSQNPADLYGIPN